MNLRHIHVSEERQLALTEYTTFPRNIMELAYCFYKIVQHWEIQQRKPSKTTVLIAVNRAFSQLMRQLENECIAEQESETEFEAPEGKSEDQL